MSLWLCLRFDQLPLQALPRKEQQATVITHHQRVVACCEIAAEYGVQPGQRNSTAQQLLEDQTCRWLKRNVEQEQHALERLLSWAYGFSPTVQIWGSDCLHIEIGGSLLLFNGFDNLLTCAVGQLSRRGFTAIPGVGDTRRGAWLLSYAPPQTAIDTSRPQAERLQPLALKLLDEFEHDICRLERAGIRTFGDLLALPSRSLGKRCSPALREWLAKLTGSQRELVANHQPPARFHDVLWFDFEIRHRSELLPAMTELLRNLCDFMRQTQRHSVQIEWQLLRTGSATPDLLTVSSSHAGLNWQDWLELTTLRLERLTSDRDIEGVALAVTNFQPLEAPNSDLFADPQHGEPLQSLVDRLRSRLGLAAIAHIGSRSEHLPEHCIYTGTESGIAPAASPRSRQRPFWLLPQPQPIQDRRGVLRWNGELTLLDGPERIEDGWWQQPTSRDYYIAQRENKEPVWIFQDRHSRRWYLHGLFD